ncbi:unnamed protein product [Moneuplotes crassus]|uniref:Isochorismatase-like domain-containing protein n=1 Tax=Euplotes crassus TaxID=5936 RepID=A0AAD2D517_EUPCR|nr:unnamed protein product [Moneuplotes crassus]
METTKPKFTRINQDDVVFFQCDIQVKMAKLIPNLETVAHNASRLAKAAKIFNIPIIVTEQYIKAFGETYPEITSEYPVDQKSYEKTVFSMLTEEVEGDLSKLGVSTVVLYGIEAHVCIQQTALDLLEKGYNVFVLTDTLLSSREIERSTAIVRMTQAGVQMTTLESALFEIMKSSKHEEFKNILEIVKDVPKGCISKL